LDDEADFVGYDEEFASVPPIPFTAWEIAELCPQWKSIAWALASAVGFVHGSWETEGYLRQVGSLQDSFGHVRAVLLFMPPGNFGDYPYLFRMLASRTDSTVLFPSGRWITPEIGALGTRNGLTFVDLADRLARLAADPAARVPLPATSDRKADGGRTVRALLHGGNGLTWDQVRIEVTDKAKIHLLAPGQHQEYRFPPNIRVSEEHALGMLMQLAAKGEWRNPPLSSPDHERIGRAFRRLRALLQALVPLPGNPFRKHRGAYIPVFQIGIHRSLLPEIQRDRRR
jgi:hypothetical protein